MKVAYRTYVGRFKYDVVHRGVRICCFVSFVTCKCIQSVDVNQVGNVSALCCVMTLIGDDAMWGAVGDVGIIVLSVMMIQIMMWLVEYSIRFL